MAMEVVAVYHVIDVKFIKPFTTYSMITFKFNADNEMTLSAIK